MRINSLESFGTVDGPGVRFVAFTQGCPLRCLYCHNPDSWHVNSEGVRNMSAEELYNEANKYRNYIKRGGVTLSGGEPLLQAKEAAQYFRLCQEGGFHTALDTSGCLWNDDVEELLSYTDLVLLDIKSIDAEQFVQITGQDLLGASLNFLEELERRHIKCWIRYVLLPGYTDNDELIAKLRSYLLDYPVVEKVEVLPYHAMGVAKYEAMGLDYPLKETNPPTKQRTEAVRAELKLRR